MNTKDWLLTFIGTGILVALIVLIVKPKSPSAQGVSAVSQSAGGDGMHGPVQPADPSIFNSLTGKTAPDFTLTDYNGNQITLSKLRSKNVILFFNEGLMCYPACWNQIASFGKNNQFKDKNTVAISITVDPKDQWKDAVTKMPELAAATVLFDTDKKVSNQYGVLNLPSSMHRGQFPGHSYVVIDKNGVVRFTNDDPNMAVHDQELLNEISQM